MIQIYLMKTDEFLEEGRFQLGCSLVDATRLRKIQSCKSTEDKVRSLCCGLLLQYAIKKELETENWNAGKSPIELSYGVGPHGKPYFQDYPRLHFNLSHSGKYAVLALSHQEIGIDIQQKRPLKDSVVKKVLTKQEYDWYKALSKEDLTIQKQSGDEAGDWFFRCWCAKESYIKLTGMGLLQELAAVVYKPKENRISHGSGMNAFCKEYRIEREYFMNVCCHEKEEFPEKVTDLSFSHILS